MHRLSLKSDPAWQLYLHRQFKSSVLAAATPRQRRLLGEQVEAEYD